MSDFGKNWKPIRAVRDSQPMAERAAELRSTLRVRDPSLVAARSASSWRTVGAERGELILPFWDDRCILPFPELTARSSRGEPLPDFQQALLLYYLLTADGTPLTGRWVSFADLPDGRMYNAAFQGYSGDEIVKRFEKVRRDNISLYPALHDFKQACLSVGGKPVEIGSASFIFQALPRVPLLTTYWLGDEDFPSSCKILFDASASHYLPIDACAILGSMLTRKLIHSRYAVPSPSPLHPSPSGRGDGGEGA
ncbi:MAG: hypothetical protein DPW18_01495 [Chloroflexi bacterium]|nr:hypothetical protein [Chloroflexota bacterium]MDL1940818.1 DUF3786 domain-containing protein [Chloroflexi bacterium CFX2]